MFAILPHPAENDRHLVIGGTTEASIIVLSKKCDKVEKKIDLVIELEPHECDSKYLLNCEWLPSSETHVAFFCGTFVKVFDARRSTISAVLEEFALNRLTITSASKARSALNLAEEEASARQRNFYARNSPR
mmetsp:Transcript_28591/g.82785  ORF Transcript_28591/g.82785 Transcript_28591/m.82785 type:complete len:132 (-) Transcript_28591:1708-2103(-)